MCLSNVYLLKGHQNEKELVLKNVAQMNVQDGKLVFTNLMGIPTIIEGEIVRVDLMENYIYVRTRD